MEGAPSLEEQREQMVQLQLVPRGITDTRVLSAMRDVRREEFVPSECRDQAYHDIALPIGEGQTISQPFMVAWMAQVLLIEPGDRLLEVGTGSGYAAAVLSKLAAEIHTVERNERLAPQARDRLLALGYTSVQVHIGDGTLGWPEAAPYDGIAVAAGGPEVPASLREQLAVGARLVIPVGAERHEQRLICVTRQGSTDYAIEDLGPVAFVPLIGREGW